MFLRPNQLAPSSSLGAIGLVGCALLVSLLGAGPSEAASVTRGPYLQLGTPESVVVRWRTDLATDSAVWFGTDPGQLDQLADDPSLVTEHVVSLTGLQPATTYFYATGTSQDVLAGGDLEHTFRTAPRPGSAAPTRVWVLGDSGTGDASARLVRDAFASWNAGRRVDLWLMLGDNAYTTGTDAEYQLALFDTYPATLKTSVLWPTLGNHDGGSANSSTQTGPYYDMFSLPSLGEAGGLGSGTEAYYSFDHGNIHFVCLNSHDVDRSVGSTMLNWLATDLAASRSEGTAEWTVVYFHHPPYSKGSHDSDTELNLVEMRENVLPILEFWGVDMVLAGHSHGYERSPLLDGHYGHSTTFAPSMVLDSGDGRPVGDGAYTKATSGSAAHEGVVYVVAGSSARLGGGTYDHPALPWSMAQLGSLVLDIQGRRLVATFVGADGLSLDHFAIFKAGAGTPLFADGFESGDTGGWSLATVRPAAR